MMLFHTWCFEALNNFVINMLNYILTENKNFYQVFIIQTSQACSWIGWCERLEGKRIKEGLLMVCVLLTHQKAGIEIEDIPFCFDTSSLLLFICFVLVFFWNIKMLTTESTWLHNLTFLLELIHCLIIAHSLNCPPRSPCRLSSILSKTLSTLSFIKNI